MMLLAGILNHLLAQAPALQAELADLRGRTVRLELPIVAAVVVVTEDGLLAESHAPAEATLSMPARFFVTRFTDRQAASRQVRISGDAELAGKAGNILAGLQWDAAEDLSLLVGDILAHRISRVAASLLEAPKEMGQRMAVSVVEYVRDERKILPQKHHVTEFCDQVDTLRDDIARLEKRLQRLEQVV
ncbi:sterol-binding protein [Deefgea tanakiae]|uniref:Ubiquinone biosynthesis accessory factor UbiJ n=2 Tax=Deefgea tanakiae TaxID=2865840 RepID=A0ABX8Z323_9NEIS|nr:SCP2 sterol-binding domain-containing protein [Deefgea tanakiae]QZA76981.1 sterol-binding protein [Deefgea tanakiae]